MCSSMLQRSTSQQANVIRCTALATGTSAGPTDSGFCVKNHCVLRAFCVRQWPGVSPETEFFHRCTLRRE